MYHYTYLIKHKYSSMKYIGSRTCACKPCEDTSYWSSSRHLPEDVATTHKKRVLKVFSTRKEALEHEIYLHDKYDVAKSEHFYNRAKQTSTAFSTEGVTLTEEHKQKCSIALTGRKKSAEDIEKTAKHIRGVSKSEAHKLALSKAHKHIASLPGYKNPRQGIVMDDELKKKISIARKLDGKSKSTNNNRFSPWFIEFNGVRQEFFDITKREKSILDGHKPGYYGDMCTRSKGIHPIKKGPFKDAIIGNIPTS